MRQPENSVFDELPGELMIWVLIVSELLVFGAGLLVFMSLWEHDPVLFAQSQDMLNRTAGAINTLVLVTSGFCAGAGVSVYQISGIRRQIRPWHRY